VLSEGSLFGGIMHHLEETKTANSGAEQFCPSAPSAGYDCKR